MTESYTVPQGLALFFMPRAVNSRDHRRRGRRTTSGVAIGFNNSAEATETPNVPRANVPVVIFNIGVANTFFRNGIINNEKPIAGVGVGTEGVGVDGVGIGFIGVGVGGVGGVGGAGGTGGVGGTIGGITGAVHTPLIMESGGVQVTGGIHTPLINV